MKWVLLVVNEQKLDKQQLVVLVHLMVLDIEQSKEQLNYLLDDVLVIFVH
jgi:hypothetical protein